MTDYLLLPATFVCSFLATWMVVLLSKSRHWLDKPNSRSSHSTPTPTAGGLAFSVVFVLAVLIMFKDGDAGFNHVLILFLASCITLLGLADDVFSLGIATRILTQLFLVVAALALFGIPALPIMQTSLEGGWIVALLFAGGFLWFINLFNFMDGIDGLAAGETLFICLGAFLITSPAGATGISVMLLILAATVSGFLLLNFPPARIFMGDTGSNFLGYILGISALASTSAGQSNVWVWCILASVFIIDATSTLIDRIRKGETWYYAHRTHAYQLAADHYGSHRKVNFLVLLINCGWLLPLAWLAQQNPQWGLMLTLLAWTVLALLVWLIRSVWRD